jgi:GntR family transcriptional repressor for pyruvate dehydrogenase complex
MAQLNKIKKTTLSDQVCRIIKDKVKTGEWAEDSRIPSENELADAFGVNRLTVRNALQKLNAMGIVETRAGEGTFVRKFDFSEYIREVSDLVTSPEMLEGVMEFRRCIELECIRLAIQRADERDIEALTKAYLQYESVVYDNGESYDKRLEVIVEADLNFHYQICIMSKNKLFTLAFDAVRDSLYQYIKQVFLRRHINYSSEQKAEQAQADATSDHRTILEAIRRKDYKACERVYLDMIDFKKS